MIDTPNKAIHIALLGGESTGKSTLAKALLDSLGGILVSEFAREYWVVKQGFFTSADMCFIALRQSRLERLAIARSHTYIISDTTPLTTVLYHYWTWPNLTIPQRMLQLIQPIYDLVILCGDDIAHEQDGMRDSEAFRTRQQIDYQSYLQQLSIPYITVYGSLSCRVAHILNHLKSK
jgi:HTH-type transcriptional regulator, transcriptional repressor of NAD biosynthesis genes